MLDQTGLGVGERGANRFGRKKNREEGVRERGFTFSLDFSANDLSNPEEARGKVDPHCKGYVWVPGLWSFKKLWEVGVFSYSDISCLKSHENGFGSSEAGNGHAFRFQGSETECLMRGLSLDSPWLDMGLCCTIRKFILD